MTWLAAWLKEVILVVLFASFVELLLPNISFHRYVKTIIGLFLLLVLMSPLFQLFRRDWDPIEAVKFAEKAQQQTITQLNSHQAKEYPSLTAILQQSRTMEAKNDQQTIVLAEQRLALMMKEGIEQRSGSQLTVQDIQVWIGIDQANNPVLKRVAVVMQQKKASEGSHSPKLHIEPVQPVMVSIVGLSSHESKDKPNTTAVKADGIEALSGPVQEIKAFIGREWQLDFQQINVSVAE